MSMDAALKKLYSDRKVIQATISSLDPDYTAPDEISRALLAEQEIKTQIKEAEEKAADDATRVAASFGTATTGDFLKNAYRGVEKAADMIVAPAIGAGIGTLLAPGPGTAAGAAIGSAAGGVASALASRLLPGTWADRPATRIAQGTRKFFGAWDPDVDTQTLEPVSNESTATNIGLSLVPGINMMKGAAKPAANAALGFLGAKFGWDKGAAFADAQEEYTGQKMNPVQGLAAGLWSQNTGGVLPDVDAGGVAFDAKMAAHGAMGGANVAARGLNRMGVRVQDAIPTKVNKAIVEGLDAEGQREREFAATAGRGEKLLGVRFSKGFETALQDLKSSVLPMGQFGEIYYHNNKTTKPDYRRVVVGRDSEGKETIVMHELSPEEHAEAESRMTTPEGWKRPAEALADGSGNGDIIVDIASIKDMHAAGNVLGLTENGAERVIAKDGLIRPDGDLETFTKQVIGHEIGHVRDEAKPVSKGEKWFRDQPGDPNASAERRADREGLKWAAGATDNPTTKHGVHYRTLADRQAAEEVAAEDAAMNERISKLPPFPEAPVKPAPAYKQGILPLEETNQPSLPGMMGEPEFVDVNAPQRHAPRPAPQQAQVKGPRKFVRETKGEALPSDPAHIDALAADAQRALSTGNVAGFKSIVDTLRQAVAAPLGNYSGKSKDPATKAHFKAVADYAIDMADHLESGSPRPERPISEAMAVSDEASMQTNFDKWREIVDKEAQRSIESDAEPNLGGLETYLSRLLAKRRAVEKTDPAEADRLTRQIDQMRGYADEVFGPNEVKQRADSFNSPNKGDENYRGRGLFFGMENKTRTEAQTDDWRVSEPNSIERRLEAQNAKGVATRYAGDPSLPRNFTSQKLFDRRQAKEEKRVARRSDSVSGPDIKDRNRRDAMANVEEYPGPFRGKEAQVTPHGVTKIISGGQTGGDRGGLTAGKELGLETGGTAPKGYRTQRGDDPSLKDFGVAEHHERDYRPRTKLNVANSDATVGFGDISSPGMTLTARFIKELGKPSIMNPTPEQLRAFVTKHGVKTLNVAGNREESSPGIHDRVVEILKAALGAGDLAQAGPMKFDKPTVLHTGSNIVSRIMNKIRGAFGADIATHMDRDVSKVGFSDAKTNSHRTPEEIPASRNKEVGKQIHDVYRKINSPVPEDTNGFNAQMIEFNQMNESTGSIILTTKKDSARPNETRAIIQHAKDSGRPYLILDKFTGETIEQSGKIDPRGVHVRADRLVVGSRGAGSDPRAEKALYRALTNKEFAGEKNPLPEVKLGAKKVGDKYEETTFSVGFHANNFTPVKSGGKPQTVDMMGPNFKKYSKTFKPGEKMTEQQAEDTYRAILASDTIKGQKMREGLPALAEELKSGKTLPDNFQGRVLRESKIIRDQFQPKRVDVSSRITYPASETAGWKKAFQNKGQGGEYDADAITGKSGDEVFKAEQEGGPIPQPSAKNPEGLVDTDVTEVPVSKSKQVWMGFKKNEVAEAAKSIGLDVETAKGIHKDHPGAVQELAEAYREYEAGETFTHPMESFRKRIMKDIEAKAKASDPDLNWEGRVHIDKLRSYATAVAASLVLRPPSVLEGETGPMIGRGEQGRTENKKQAKVDRRVDKQLEIAREMGVKLFFGGEGSGKKALEREFGIASLNPARALDTKAGKDNPNAVVRMAAWATDAMMRALSPVSPLGDNLINGLKRVERAIGTKTVIYKDADGGEHGANSVTNLIVDNMADSNVRTNLLDKASTNMMNAMDKVDINHEYNKEFGKYSMDAEARKTIKNTEEGRNLQAALKAFDELKVAYKEVTHKSLEDAMKPMGEQAKLIRQFLGSDKVKNLDAKQLVHLEEYLGNADEHITPEVVAASGEGGYNAFRKSWVAELRSKIGALAAKNSPGGAADKTYRRFIASILVGGKLNGWSVDKTGTLVEAPPGEGRSNVWAQSPISGAERNVDNFSQFMQHYVHHFRRHAIEMPTAKLYTDIFLNGEHRAGDEVAKHYSGMADDVANVIRYDTSGKDAGSLLNTIIPPAVDWFAGTETKKGVHPLTEATGYIRNAVYRNLLSHPGFWALNATDPFIKLSMFMNPAEIAGLSAKAYQRLALDKNTKTFNDKHLPDNRNVAARISGQFGERKGAGGAIYKVPGMRTAGKLMDHIGDITGLEEKVNDRVIFNMLLEKEINNPELPASQRREVGGSFDAFVAKEEHGTVGKKMIGRAIAKMQAIQGKVAGIPGRAPLQARLSRGGSLDMAYQLAMIFNKYPITMLRNLAAETNKGKTAGLWQMLKPGLGFVLASSALIGLPRTLTSDLKDDDPAHMLLNTLRNGPLTEITPPIVTGRSVAISLTADPIAKFLGGAAKAVYNRDASHFYKGAADAATTLGTPMVFGPHITYKAINAFKNAQKGSKNWEKLGTMGEAKQSKSASPLAGNKFYKLYKELKADGGNEDEEVIDPDNGTDSGFRGM